MPNLLHHAPRDPDPDRDPERQSRPKLLDISVPQVIGGALAAMTAATLGSRLGVAGTVTGAAVASLVATLGGALYAGSLRRTHFNARSWWARTRGRTGAASSLDRPVADQPARPAPALPATADDRSHRVPDASPGPPTRRLHPLGILVGAAATMAVAIAGLTGAELVAGHGLDGSQHTIVERIVIQRTTAPSGSTPNDPASATPTASPSTSDTPADSPTTSPSATAPRTPAPSTQAGRATPTQESTPQSSESSKAPSTPADGHAAPSTSTQDTTESGTGADATQSLQGVQR